MKPIWKTTLKVLRVIGKILVWLASSDSSTNKDEKKADKN